MLRTRVRASAAAGLALSLVFAMLATAVQSADLFVPGWQAVPGRTTRVTLRVPGYRRAGAIIPRGTLLDPEVPDDRVALAFDAAQHDALPVRLLASATLQFLALFVFTTCLRRFGASPTKLLRTQVGMLSAMVLLLAFAKAFLLWTQLPELWIPIAVVPLWCTSATNRRTALLVSVTLALITSALLEFEPRLLFVLATQGLAAALPRWNLKRPGRLVLEGAGGTCRRGNVVSLADRQRKR